MGIRDRLATASDGRVRQAMRDEWPDGFPGRQAEPSMRVAGYRPVERGLTLQDLHAVVVQHEDVAYSAGWADALRQAEERQLAAVAQAEQDMAAAVLAEITADGADVRAVAQELDRMAAGR
jgi:hypothetical protein